VRIPAAQFYTLRVRCTVHIGGILPNESNLTAQKLDAITAWMNNEITAQRSVHVHCTLGQSRSASIIIAYLMRYHGKNYVQALAELNAQSNNAVNIHGNFVLQLAAYYLHLNPPPPLPEKAVSRTDGGDGDGDGDGGD